MASVAGLGGRCAARTLGCSVSPSKPDTGDVREAPSTPLITGLLDMGATVRGYDPAGMEQAGSLLQAIEFCADAYACAKDAERSLSSQNGSSFVHSILVG
jgi:UDPglucose 6-dehydrogenase